MSAEQQTLSGDPLPEALRGRSHLSLVQPDSSEMSNHTADAGRNEAWCRQCGLRVTVGEREYGHARACKHSCWRVDG